MRLSHLHCLAAALLLAVVGCAKSTSPTRPGPATIEGTLSLSGTLRDSTGAVTGSRVVNAPDGIRVYLLRSGAFVDSTLTLAGKYSFAVTDGTYQLLLRVGPLPLAGSNDITVDAGTIFLQIPPFQMSSVGSLEASPNPFVTSLNTRFDLASADVVGLGVYDLGNRQVRSLVAGTNLAAGSHVVQWNGQSDHGDPIADGAYWVVFSSGGHTAAELVFKGP